MRARRIGISPSVTGTMSKAARALALGVSVGLGVVATSMAAPSTVASLATISVSPQSGPSTQRLRITYKGPPPQAGFPSVTVVFSWDGVNFGVFLLTKANGYTASMTFSPPSGHRQVGAHKVCGTEGSADTLACATFTVLAPKATPTPTPTRRPSPAPTPRPSPSLEPTQAPPASPGPTVDSVPSPSPAPTSSPAPESPPTATATALATPVSDAASSGGIGDWLLLAVALAAILGIGGFVFARRRAGS